MIPALRRYRDQRGRCLRRGQAWEMSFDQWYQWWLSQGQDKNYPENSDQMRSAGPNRGAMHRIDPALPWSVTNIEHRSQAGARRNPAAVDQHNVRSRPVITPQGEFASVAAAARYYGIQPASMWHRLQDRPEIYHYK